MYTFIFFPETDKVYHKIYFLQQGYIHCHLFSVLLSRIARQACNGYYVTTSRDCHIYEEFY